MTIPWLSVCKMVGWNSTPPAHARQATIALAPQECAAGVTERFQEHAYHSAQSLLYAALDVSQETPCTWDQQESQCHIYTLPAKSQGMADYSSGEVHGSLTVQLGGCFGKSCREDLSHISLFEFVERSCHYSLQMTKIAAARNDETSHTRTPPWRLTTRLDCVEQGLEEMSSATDSEDLLGEEAMGGRKGDSSDADSLIIMDVSDSWLRPT
uniref:Uncharacterized protein n=1 Tax=Eutreptiella gymnastica TaxID=73025 RepID=A0A7S4GKE2_9EUGL|mmetsp:Transcript_4959/g.7854  ORF Transcript_4959/g.7854 Transcript_4959/m.7854 type:complete len:211 (+) Transcript_4959:26-658(+)